MQRRRVLPSTKATRSCRGWNGDADVQWQGFAVFELLRQDTKCEHLGFGHGFICRRTVGEYTWQLRDFSQPASIVFALALKTEFHARIIGEQVNRATANVLVRDPQPAAPNPCGSHRWV